jgi:glutamate-1-semialdehyde aminotransferase
MSSTHRDGQSTTPSTTTRLLERAVAVTPHGSQTLSKSHRMQAHGSPAVPLFIESAEGAWVTDVEGRRFLDYPMSLGPVILGHNHPRVNEAISEQLSRGVLFSLPSPLEIEVAEAVVAAIPSAEMVKFVKTGSEACAAAVRIARAYTRREVVAVGGFHGWHDFYAAVTSRSAGVPARVSDLTVPFRFDDISSLESVLAERGPDIAAVMLEPASDRKPSPGYLDAVAEATRNNGSLLIFDEVITGFRWSRGGAQERYGVYPDLTVLGKALGNGMPIAAVCGPGEIMRSCEEIFVSGTYGGECLSLAAAKAVLEVLEDEPVVDYIWDQGRRLAEGMRREIGESGLEGRVRCSGEPPRVVLSFPSQHAEERPGDALDSTDRPLEDLVAKSIFQQEMAKREILFNGSFFLSYAHTDSDIEMTVDAVAESLEVVAEALGSEDPRRFLIGTPAESVF